MKIGFIVNDVMTEEAGFTTVRLAHEAHKQGHEAFMIGVGDLAYDPDEFIRARAQVRAHGQKVQFSRDVPEGPAGREGAEATHHGR